MNHTPEAAGWSPGLSMLTGATKIVKPEGQEADEFEQTAAQELFNLQMSAADIKSEIRDLYSTGASHVIPHRSTSPARRRLTSQSGQDVVQSTWYGRSFIFPDYIIRKIRKPSHLIVSFPLY